MSESENELVEEITEITDDNIVSEDISCKILVNSIPIYVASPESAYAPESKISKPGKTVKEAKVVPIVKNDTPFQFPVILENVADYRDQLELKEKLLQERENSIQSLMNAIMHTDNNCRKLTEDLRQSKELATDLKGEVQLLNVEIKLLLAENVSKDAELSKAESDISRLQNSVSNYCDANVKLKNQLKVMKGSDDTTETATSNTKQKETMTTLIMTTSMARDIKDKQFNESLAGGHAIFSRHHGGMVNRVRDALEMKMKEVKPDAVVFQAGGNDLWTSKSPLALANEIVGAGKMAVEFGAKVAISSILPRSDFHLNLKRWETNILLGGLCQSNNITFIDNKEIVVQKHLLKDGVHLNKSGTKLFSSNIINCLNKL